MSLPCEDDDDRIDLALADRRGQLIKGQHGRDLALRAWRPGPPT